MQTRKSKKLRTPEIRPSTSIVPPSRSYGPERACGERLIAHHMPISLSDLFELRNSSACQYQGSGRNASAATPAVPESAGWRSERLPP